MVKVGQYHYSMPWLHVLSGHQQQWHWPSKTNCSLLFWGIISTTYTISSVNQWLEFWNSKYLCMFPKMNSAPTGLTTAININSSVVQVTASHPSTHPFPGEGSGYLIVISSVVNCYRVQAWGLQGCEWAMKHGLQSMATNSGKWHWALGNPKERLTLS